MIYFDSERQRWTVEVDRYVDTASGSQRVRKVKRLPAGTTEEKARQIAAVFEARVLERYLCIPGMTGWDQYVDAMLADRRSWIYTTVIACRSRAAARGMAFGLTPAAVAEALRRSRGRCEVTGLAFSDAAAGKRQKRPFFHSLDRRDSTSGYTPDNIRVVCFAVNMAMSNWGEHVFEQLAAGYVFNKYSVAAQPVSGGGVGVMARKTKPPGHRHLVLLQNQ